MRYQLDRVEDEYLYASTITNYPTFHPVNRIFLNYFSEMCLTVLDGVVGYGS